MCPAAQPVASDDAVVEPAAQVRTPVPDSKDAVAHAQQQHRLAVELDDCAITSEKFVCRTEIYGASGRGHPFEHALAIRVTRQHVGACSGFWAGLVDADGLMWSTAKSKSMARFL